jgi:putative hydrolase of the HAD superfamily
MIKAILFDLDETLVNRQETMRVFLMEQHSHFSLQGQCSGEEFAKTCLNFQHHGYRPKEEAYLEACKELQLSADLSMKLFAHYRLEYGKNAFPFPGSVETIAKLSQHYPLGLVSNGTTRGQMGKLQSVGLLPYFDSILISESFGVKKPNPTIFLACLQELGVAPQDALFIGDHPEADIQPAMALKMKAVWVQNKNFPPPLDCDARVDSVQEIPDILESIAS